jgi:drug/metabolite transporter (DMT)-like permease
MKAALLGIVLIAAMAEAQQQPKPRLEPARVMGQVALGAYAGVGGFIVGRYLGEELVQRAGSDHEPTIRRVGFATGAIGGGLATAGVVYGIGSIGDQSGDFDATALGAGVGFAVSMALARVLLGPELSPPSGMRTTARWATANLIALLPAVGASIGFNSTRRSP